MGKKRKSGEKEAEGKPKSSSSSGLDEIDSLFSAKKKQEKQEKEEAKVAAAKRKRLRVDASKKRHDKSVNKSVLEEHFSIASSRKWVDDGLGGKFNSEGYTGRVEDGVKVFKAHVLNKPNFGSSKDCPFDCDCCYI